MKRVVGILAVALVLLGLAYAIWDRAPSSENAAERARPAEAVAVEFPASLFAPGRPQLALVEALTTSQLAVLPERCATEEKLVAKEGMIWALALRGEARGFPPIRDCLLADRKGAVLPQQEEMVLIGSILALGLLSEASDDALAMVKDGTNPEYWRKNRSWTSATFGDDSPNLFAAHSIHALGVSGRQDAMQFVETLRGEPAIYLHRFAGDMAEAAFYHDLRRDNGAGHLKQYFVQQSGCVTEHLEKFGRWTETPNGRRWHQWVQARTRGPRPAG